MIVAELWMNHMNDWRGQLRDSHTGELIGEEWQAHQRGALISLMLKWIPLSHLVFRDLTYWQ